MTAFTATESRLIKATMRLVDELPPELKIELATLSKLDPDNYHGLQAHDDPDDPDVVWISWVGKCIGGVSRNWLVGDS